MAGEIIEIPLFPLSLVLFPGMVQPLHIFEPRYREMTRYCLDTNVCFGITLAQEGSALGKEIPARVGAMARILDYQRLPDGRYNLMTVGTSRFEIVEMAPGKPYLAARVRLLADEAGDGDLSGLAAQARRLLDEYLAVVLAIGDGEEKSVEIPIPDDPVELSYFIAVCLPVDDHIKQELLEAATAEERLAYEAHLLRYELEHGCLAEDDAAEDDEQPLDDDGDEPPIDRTLLN